jgi:hypothetical protein
MSDVITWFREQLDQDEAAARKAGGYWEHLGGGVVAETADDAVLDVFPIGEAAPHVAAHIARWDPAAVLADIAAKRAVLDLRDEWHENLRAWQVPEGQTRPEHLIAAQGWYQALTHAVALLAQAYAGRPGFDPAWRDI